MLPHVTAVCKSSFFHLRNIFKIRKFLSYDTCKTLIHAFVTARIDYCNSLLYGQPKCILKRLQSVLNSAARLIHLKARLHRRLLSRQIDAIFVALKLQLQNRTCKPGAIFSANCRRDIAGVSNWFETLCNFAATKIASSCRDKNRLCKRAFTSRYGRK